MSLMRRLGQRVRTFRWGEAFLWIMFLLTGLSGVSGTNSDAVLLAGLFALSAIGVRATRVVPVAVPDDK